MLDVKPVAYRTEKDINATPCLAGSAKVKQHVEHIDGAATFV